MPKMSYSIPNYPNYIIKDNNLYRFNKRRELIEINLKKGGSNKNCYKVKDVDNKWQWKSKAALWALAGLKLELPKTAKLIEGTDHYYIDIDGSVYSFSPLYPAGIKMSPHINTKGYPMVRLIYKDKSSKFSEVHKLVLKTFVMSDYTEKGLCCMHLNNIKTDNRLENLAVGTYSENNKAAYRDGLNPGNGLKKN